MIGDSRCCGYPPPQSTFSRYFGPQSTSQSTSVPGKTPPQSTSAVHFFPGSPLAQSTFSSRQSTCAVHFTFQAIHFRSPLHFPGNPLSQSTSLKFTFQAIHFRSPLHFPGNPLPQSTFPAVHFSPVYFFCSVVKVAFKTDVEIPNSSRTLLLDIALPVNAIVCLTKHSPNCNFLVSVKVGPRGLLREQFQPIFAGVCPPGIC